MADHLTTPLIHKFMVSPAGILLHTQLFERLKTRTVPQEFGVAKARAVADVTYEEGVDAFVERLGITAPLPDRTHERIADALTAHGYHRRDYEDISAQWDDAFWSREEAVPPMDRRVALEIERRELTETWATPTSTFRFLTKQDLFDPVEYDVPAPTEATADWVTELHDPETVYAAPTETPEIERSAPVEGPGTREFLVRYPSPSRYTGDTAYARVYEPADGPEALPTIIYGPGLGMMYDLLSYYPEEEYIGRALAPEGFRAILVESPWHGRRERVGFFSGEPYLQSMPVSLFQLYASQAQEIAVLTDWARTRGAPSVGVGGVSLGGIVTLFVAGHSIHWPERYRPDAAFPVAMSANIDQLVLSSSIVGLLDGDDALRSAGWGSETLAEFAPLLRPPEAPGIDPKRIYPFGGLQDKMTDYASARALFDRWDVPEANRTEWECGHFGTLLRAIRKDDLRQTIGAALETMA
jgi:hypothetical protein